jgi:hypothetical protein
LEIHLGAWEVIMTRDAEKSKKTGAENDALVQNKKSDAHSRAEDRKQGKRGWSDVFDNLTYSTGPGDNIYVFG